MGIVASIGGFLLLLVIVAVTLRTRGNKGRAQAEQGARDLRRDLAHDQAEREGQ